MTMTKSDYDFVHEVCNSIEEKLKAENARLVAERDEFFAYAAVGESFPQVVDELDHLRYHAKASEDAYKQAQARVTCLEEALLERKGQETRTHT